MNCYGSLYTNLSYRIIFLAGADWTRRGKGEGKQLGMRLARSIAAVAEVDPAEGIKAIRQVALGTFPGAVIISPKEQTLEEVNTPRND